MKQETFFNVNKTSERKFGMFFSFVFFIVSIYLFSLNNLTYIITFLISLFLIFLSLFFSSYLKFPNYLWMKIGQILHFLVSPLIMFLIFIVTFYPIGLFLKLFKIDIININYNKKINSYWIERSKDINSLKKMY